MYTATTVSDTPTVPSNLPIMMVNGDTEPSSTSAMRCIFSSSTAFTSGIAPIMIIMNIRNIIRAIGTPER